jgi:hypothetical protein
MYMLWKDVVDISESGRLFNEKKRCYIKDTRYEKAVKD